MKKYSFLQAAIIAALALVVGIFLGIAVVNKSPGNTDSQVDYYEMGKYLGGSIGKVDRYRNVKVTEDDIILRNELVEDSAKRNLYEKYLLYNYYQSLKTTSDVDVVLKKVSETPEFLKIYYPYIAAIESFKQYLEPAREDILFALNMIISLDSNAKVPVIGYMNQAQNAISRIQNHQNILLNLMNAITSFIDSNPEGKYWALEDAHDIISLNMTQAAILSQNKPVLNYLEKKKMYNDKEGSKELVADNQLRMDAMNAVVLSDIQTLGIHNAEQLGVVIYTDVQQLGIYFSVENLSAIMAGNQEALNSLLLNMEGMGMVVGINEQLQVTLIGAHEL